MGGRGARSGKKKKGTKKSVSGILVNNTKSRDLEDSVVDGQLLFNVSKRQPAWVAEVSGLDPKYKFKRSFVDPNDSGPGWQAWNLSEKTIYNVNPSANKKDNYFVMMKKGVLHELSQGDVEKLLKKK